MTATLLSTRPSRFTNLPTVLNSVTPKLYLYGVLSFRQMGGCLDPMPFKLFLGKVVQFKFSKKVILI